MPLTALKKILNPNIIDNSINTSIAGSPTIYLKETGINKIGKINLHLPKGESLIIKLDAIVKVRLSKPSRNKSSYLNESLSDIHSSCDYVVFSENKGKLWITFIELKSDSTKGAHSQLYYSIPHIEYYLSLVEHHEPCTFTKEYKFILFSSKTSMNKTGTKPGKVLKTKLLDGKKYSCYIPGAPTDFYLNNILI